MRSKNLSVPGRKEEFNKVKGWRLVPGSKFKVQSAAINYLDSGLKTQVLG